MFSRAHAPQIKVFQMITTAELLVNKYGVLLSLEATAQLLNRSKDGLRVSLSRQSDIAEQLNKAKVKLGRRVMFKASAIAEIIDAASA